MLTIITRGESAAPTTAGESRRRTSVLVGVSASRAGALVRATERGVSDRYPTRRSDAPPSPSQWSPRVQPNQERTCLCAGSSSQLNAPVAPGGGRQGVKSPPCRSQTDTTVAKIFVLSLATIHQFGGMHAMNIGRPLPLHGSVSGHLMDYHAWEQRAMRDQVIDANEAFEAVAILQRIVPDVSDLAITVEHVTTCLTASHGIKSPRAKRGWNELQARQPANVLTFRARDEEGPEAA